MKPNSLEQLLQQPAPAPDPAARLAARRAALAEFQRAHPANAGATNSPRRSLFQALSGWLRPSREDKSHGSSLMAWNSRRMLLGGVASVGIALFGSALVWNLNKQQPELVALPAAKPVPVAEPAEPPKNEASEAYLGSEQQSAAQPAPAADKKRDDASRLSAAAPNKPASGTIAESIPASDSGKLPDSPAAEAKEKDAETEEITVTGERRAMEQSMDMKREAVGVVDANSSESLDEIVTTGRRGNGNRSATPHKGMTGVPQRGGGSGYARQKVASANGGVLAGQLQPAAPGPSAAEGRDKFEHFELNSVKQVADEPVSTFSADVDTASYSFARKQLMAGALPQKHAVRVEEMVNYFDYSWPAAESRDKPFRPTVVVSDSPWGKGRKLVHIGIKGYELPERDRPDANLVMLLDVSGSMDEPDKLPLVKESMKLMLGSLKRTDTVAIVVYAGAAGMVLPPTPVGDKEKIVEALDRLQAGGSTAGAEGLELAYQLAEKSFRKQGVNRILLCTDGDFNVGIDNTNELKGFVERKREKGIFLSFLGFGMGNYRDELAQALAQNGNGVAAYIDTLNEARKVLVQEAGASLFTIAKDVKFQVEFNPATVAEYRLVGYETRALRKEDFNNDAVDAGDVGSGHAVTAIYEITPVGSDARMVDESRYSRKPKPAPATGTANEYGFLKIRYKLPEQRKSELIEQPISVDAGSVAEPIRSDVQFSTAVAGFAQLLRGGQFTGSLSYEDVIKQAQAAVGADPYGYRSEFVQLVRKAQSLR